MQWKKISQQILLILTSGRRGHGLLVDTLPRTCRDAHISLIFTDIKQPIPPLGRHGLAWWIFHFGDIASFALNRIIKGEKAIWEITWSNLLWVEWINLWCALGCALFRSPKNSSLKLCHHLINFLHFEICMMFLWLWNPKEFPYNESECNIFSV